MTRLAAILCVAVLCAACAPPPPPAIWYDAANDVMYPDDALLTQTAEWYGQPGVDWLVAHDEGHRRMMQVWRTDHRALWLLMPGETAAIQIEQLAQCEASASGLVQPWEWGPDAVAAGYWDCPAELVALVGAA